MIQTPKVQITGLELLSRSPFKATLPVAFDPGFDSFNEKEALTKAETVELLPDATKYLKSKGPISRAYQEGVRARLYRSSNLLSGALQSELESDLLSDYLTFKLLSEFALSQVDISEQLLSLDELILYIEKTKNLEEAKDDIKTQIKNNSKLIENILCQNGGISPDDLDILKTLTSANNALHEKFDETIEELEFSIKYISNQRLLALSLSHFDDLDIKQDDLKIPQSQQNNDTQNSSQNFEELISYIASAAVQKNISLPSPDSSNNLAAWAKTCLDCLLYTPSTIPTPRELPVLEKKKFNEKEVDRLKIALKDLQFSHMYLAKQYEEERNSNITSLEAQEKKKQIIEMQLSENIILLEKTNQRCMLIEHEKDILETKYDEKVKEVLELQRSLANLKIENLGYVQNDNHSHTSSVISVGKENRVSPTSPLTGMHLNTDDEKSFKYGPGTRPQSPLLQHDININNYRLSQSQTSPRFNSSISVLRKEFKKLVSDMQNNFESELQKEKLERMRLENLVKLFEERDSELESF